MLNKQAFVELWIWHDIHLLDSQQADEYQRAFSPSEQQYLSRISNRRRQLEYIGGHYLLRQMLDYHFPGWSNVLTIEHSPGEAPFFGGFNPDRIEFNLSHSGNSVCCAVSVNCNIGIDIESPGRHRPYQEIADTYLANSEAERMNKLSADGKEKLFYRIWTLKESLLKARRGSLNSTEMKVEFRRLTRSCLQASKQQCAWYCYSFRTGSQYLALSVSRPLAGRLELRFFTADLGRGTAEQPQTIVYTPIYEP